MIGRVYRLVVTITYKVYLQIYISKRASCASTRPRRRPCDEKVTQFTNCTRTKYNCGGSVCDREFCFRHISLGLQRTLLEDLELNFAVGILYRKARKLPDTYLQRDETSSLASTERTPLTQVRNKEKENVKSTHYHTHSQ